MRGRKGDWLGLGVDDGRDGSVTPKPSCPPLQRGLVQPRGCRAARKEKEAFGVHTRTCCIPGAGDSSAGWEGFGSTEPSPLH